MKKYILTLIVVASGLGAFAQLSKDEIKEVKSEMKAMTPEEFLELKNSAGALEEELEEKETAVQELQAENANLQSKLDDREATIKQFEDMAAETKPEPTEQEVSETNYSENYEQPISKGVVYKVQIGAFKNFDMREYFGKHPNFSGEVDESGMMKYTLGQFVDYWEADKFKKYLRQMGVNGAWIVSYKDGVRVDIKDALEGAL